MFAYAKPGQKQTDKSVAQKKETENKSSPNLKGVTDKMKTDFKNYSGFSFNDMRERCNSDKSAQLQALAYTQRGDTHIFSSNEKCLTRMENSDEKKVIQCFNVPANLTKIKTDVQAIEYDIAKTGVATDIKGADFWAEETRDAALRKLDEWNALKLAYSLDVTNVPNFGEDVVQEPDVYAPSIVAGAVTNVVENKYVTGKRDRITTNVKDAMGQLICSNRSNKYVGTLTARIKLSDETRENLRGNGNQMGDNRMINGWRSYGKALTDKVTRPHELWLKVENLPDRANVGMGCDFHEKIK